MPRKIRNCPELNAFHIYSRSNNKLGFGLNPESLWTIFSNQLYFLHHAYKVNIHAFTLMSNHFHLLCSFPHLNISPAMNYFMSETSRSINIDRGSINHVYGGRFKSTLIQTPHHFSIAYKYVIQNPLRAGIAKHLLSYKYCSVHGVYGYSKIIIPITTHNLGLDYEINEMGNDIISWISQDFEEKELIVLRNVLSRRIFKVPKDRTTRKPFQFQK